MRKKQKMTIKTVNKREKKQIDEITNCERIIKTICPQLAKSENVQDFIEISSESLNKDFFADMIDYAVAYKACHLFTLFNEADDAIKIANLGAGAVTGISEGGLSVSFATPQNDSEYNSTRYGKMLLRLIKSRPKIDVNRFF